MADAANTLECDIPGLLQWRFGEEKARRITLPTLCVLGGNSNALWERFGEVQRLLLEWPPAAEDFVLPGTTHLLQVERPPKMAAALAGFYARH